MTRASRSSRNGRVVYLIYRWRLVRLEGSVGTQFVSAEVLTEGHMRCSVFGAGGRDGRRHERGPRHDRSRGRRVAGSSPAPTRGSRRPAARQRGLAVRDGGTKFRSRCRAVTGRTPAATSVPTSPGSRPPATATSASSGIDPPRHPRHRHDAAPTRCASPTRKSGRCWRIVATLTPAPECASRPATRRTASSSSAPLPRVPHGQRAGAGSLGPDLSRVGSGRSRPVLMNKLRGTGTDGPPRLRSGDARRPAAASGIRGVKRTRTSSRSRSSTCASGFRAS